MSNYSGYISGERRTWHRYPPGTVIAVSMNQRPTIKEKIKNCFKCFKKEQKVMKFKVGDKVKIVSPKGFACQEFKGMTAEVTGFGKTNIDHKDAYNLRFDGEIENSSYWWTDDEVVSADTFIKSDLKDGMVVERRCGDKCILLNQHFMTHNTTIEVSNYTYDLRHPTIDDMTIDKVYISHAKFGNDYFEDSYLELIWERKEEPDYKEMTVAEIEKKLGYKVKIVDGE
jgi:hypothetical protein